MGLYCSGFRWRCDDRDTLEDEVIACLQGVQAAIDVGIGHVAETDAPIRWSHHTGSLF
jgi:hypothetical protein